MTANTRRRRQFTVWWHVLTSVGWMAMSVVLLTLLATAVAGPAEAAAATATARRIDVVLLAPLANASAATGIVLALGTPWGLTRHRWVLAKFAITLVQLWAGIFLLSGALDAIAVGAPVSVGMLAGTAAMAGATATQAWLSVAKPGGTVRTRGHQPRRPPVAPSWVLPLAVFGPMADIGLGLWLGYPSPFLSGAVVVAASAAWWVERQRQARERREARPVTVPTAG